MISYKFRSPYRLSSSNERAPSIGWLEKLPSQRGGKEEPFILCQQEDKYLARSTGPHSLLSEHLLKYLLGISLATSQKTIGFEKFLAAEADCGLPDSHQQSGTAPVEESS